MVFLEMVGVYQMSSKNRKRKTYNSIVIFLLILLILFVGILAYIIIKDKNQEMVGSSAHIDRDATEWDDGIDNENESEGRILVPGYSGAKMKNGDKVLNLRIGNPKENTCYLQATLQLADGTVLYESGLIEPGKGYDSVELNQTLGVGEYEAFVHYQGYSMDESKEQLNSCDSAFILKVTE